MNRSIILCLSIFIALTTTVRPASFQSWGEKEFVGTINHVLKVRIRLSRSDKMLSGSYVYEKVGKNIRLTGTMTYDNEFKLDEVDERGVITGEFEGKFVSRDWIEGTWSSPTTRKGLPFTAWVIDGEEIPTSKADDRLTGEYSRVDKRGRVDPDSAVFDVWLLKDGRVRVWGYSSWVGNAKTGNVNVGEVNGIFQVQGSKLFFKDGGDDNCEFTITFGTNFLLVTDDNLRCGGLNVSFDGKYKKVGPANSH